MKILNKWLVYFGSDGFEEYYLNLGEDSVRGGSFEGLRPNTEEELREVARNTEPEEYMTIPDQMRPYFNYEQWYEDMEEDWYGRHDVQAEEERDGETYYFGFGSSTDIFHYFESNRISTYKTYKEHFEDAPIDEVTFNKILRVVQDGQKKDALKMTSDEEGKEREVLAAVCGIELQRQCEQVV